MKTNTATTTDITLKTNTGTNTAITLKKNTVTTKAMTVKTTNDKKSIIISTRTTNKQTEVNPKNRQTIASRTTVANTIDKEFTKKETLDSGKTDYTHGTLITITVISIVCVFILALIMLKRKFGRNNGFVNQAFEMASF